MQINLFNNFDAINPLEILESKQGTTLKIKATPKASSNRMGKIENGALKIYVTDAPEDSKANTAVLKLLSKSLGLPISSLEIISGHHHRLKIICFKEISAEELKGLLAKIV